MTQPRFKPTDKVRSVLRPENTYVVEKVDTRRRMLTVRVDDPRNDDLVFVARTSLFVAA